MIKVIGIQKACTIIVCFFSINILLANKTDEFKKHFDNILLIINYNHPHYESIDFLKKIYGSVFSHIVFYGEKADPRVQTINHHFGWYGYRTLADAIERYPNFRGYLYTNDDCFLNFWNLTRFDKSKIWLDKPTRVALISDAFSSHVWYWWSKECGYMAAKKVYDHICLKYKLQLRDNCGESAICYGFSDMVYLPQEYSQEAKNLFAQCSDQGVFLEIALPMVNACLAPEKSWEFFNSLVPWSRDRYKPLELYKFSYDVIHPLKFSDKKICAFIEQQVEQAIAGFIRKNEIFCKQ